ncbi:DUF421 domain-containing protein [Clostridium algidicarnis]|uniref:Uncharacterized membrane protein YcaP (DUF421 family) n=2 Tax=Clostridium algidicarnis TaxID=37659 RepID=A0A2S6G058_9CLOT|nr:DUF421 domain-containing protein [Clostridium algidicarnis]MBB6630847.1 DUF421 domain-containing protein [Clostridium algidicarnis]MBB6696749.1 DUF421 domain-containing protein [Clostridium algidicarnis]MBU3192696.1 DUF421 domain-containing protein [Clostridium algidicarnis]MBU3204020.1 DUF421 domain-containing protein [Clostridium algidicarnis]MBU3207370.1 DUF421 domain-containing protein [Clostridium algidicarnis]
MFIVFFRTIILYVFVVITMRLMGKRQIGELQPFELVITIMVSELAALPMQNAGIPIIHGIIPIITLLTLQVILSEIQLKSDKFRSLIDGRPSILIKNGKVNIDELKNQRLSINDLLEELRIKGELDISDIAYALIETDGQMSIINKHQHDNVKREDLNIKEEQISLPVLLICNGEIKEDGLDYYKKDEKWIKDILTKNNINSEKEVFIALMDSKGEFFYQLMKER